MHDLNMASRFSDKMLMLKKGCIFAVGTPEKVLTEENIETVYGIKARVTKSIMGKPQVVPLEPLSYKVSETPSKYAFLT